MDEQTHTVPATVARDLTVGDLLAAIAAGWSDFKAHTMLGLFVAAVYVAAGLLLYFVLFHQDEVTWIVSAAAGFPLIAPFSAVGLYEVSRRREAGLPINRKAILAALRGNGDDQIVYMGVILFVFLGFWLGLAHGIFAIFLGETGVGSGSLVLFRTEAGMLMLLIGGAVGAAMALALFSITAISLPMLVDREVDFVTAMIVSVAAVRSNTFVLLLWAGIIAAALFVAIVPFFLGLLVVLPVLGHASWHLYRRLVE